MNQGMVWWRVALDRDGSIRSCVRVEEVGTSTGSIAFVQANDQMGAVIAAKAWCKRRNEMMRKSQLKRIAARTEAGLCKSCGSPIVPPSTAYCAKHAAMQRENARRHRAGETRPRTRTPLEIMQHHRDYRHQRSRILVSLPWVIDRLDEVGPFRFRQWLVDEIRRRGGLPPIVETEAAE